MLLTYYNNIVQPGRKNGHVRLDFLTFPDWFQEGPVNGLSFLATTVHCLATQVGSFRKTDSLVFHTWYVIIISLLIFNCTLKHIDSMIYK